MNIAVRIENGLHEPFDRIVTGPYLFSVPFQVLIERAFATKNLIQPGSYLAGKVCPRILLALFGRIDYQ